MGVGDQRHAAAALPPRQTRYLLYRWARWPVWAGTENIAPIGIRSTDRPARSESLYRLSYPGPHYIPCIGQIQFPQSLRLTLIGHCLVMGRSLAQVPITIEKERAGSLCERIKVA